MDPRRLAPHLPVEYLGTSAPPDSSEGYLRHGHPGVVTDPSPQDVFVRWAGLEREPWSRWVCYDYQGLGELDEQEYALRVQRLQAGLDPVERPHCELAWCQDDPV